MTIRLTVKATAEMAAIICFRGLYCIKLIQVCSERQILLLCHHLNYFPSGT